ncbi:unnamed protein product [Adineta steineri]|uniref:Uncharacterized protein n=1 Tax=Adineta steineri TaxID=433720 RepID=A0A819P7D4_9BILA|nr:unnamed protein product [Adineta steineri]
MLKLLSFITVFILLLLSSADAKLKTNELSTSEVQDWAEITTARLVACYYDNSTGLFTNELKWQSGSTLETLANFVSLADSPQRYIFSETFKKTDPFIGGNCFDDYLWWALAWIQIYKVDPHIEYLQRAALIHDFVSDRAWTTTTCNGGLQVCPTNTYKNAITNELFLLSSMRLHPYTKLLEKPPTYYLEWALKEWKWFEKSGMINSEYLINEGLRSCVNDNRTTWTHNQGVILSGLALLYSATHNSTLIDIAQKIADAAIRHLTYPNGILKEACEPKCDTNHRSFKGIFARHLGYLMPYLTDASHIQKYTLFLRLNSVSSWTTSRCEMDGLFNIFWDSKLPDACDAPRDTATTSSVLDLFISTAKTSQTTRKTAKWMLIGLGNCMDDNNASMPNFYQNAISEDLCRQTADEDKGAVAYDYQISCTGYGFCRIRTLSSESHTPPGFEYQDDVARRVTTTNKVTIASCYVKII